MGWKILPHDVTKAEGDEGRTEFRFKLVFDGQPGGGFNPSKSGVTLQISHIGADHSVSFSDGQRNKDFVFEKVEPFTHIFSVYSEADTRLEPDEMFKVELHSELLFHGDLHHGNGENIAAVSAYGLVINDDPPSMEPAVKKWLGAIVRAEAGPSFPAGTVMSKAELKEVKEQVIREEVGRAAKDGLTSSEIRDLKDIFGPAGLGGMLDKELGRVISKLVRDASVEDLDGDFVAGLRETFEGAGGRPLRVLEREVKKAVRDDVKERLEAGREDDGVLDAADVEAIAARFEGIGLDGVLKKAFRKEARMDLRDIDPNDPDAPAAIDALLDAFGGYGFDRWLGRKTDQLIERIEAAWPSDPVEAQPEPAPPPPVDRPPEDGVPSTGDPHVPVDGGRPTPEEPAPPAPPASGDLPTPPGGAEPYPDPPADDGPRYTPPTNGEPAYPPAGGADTPSPPTGGTGSPYPPGTPDPETIVGPGSPATGYPTAPVDGDLPTPNEPAPPASGDLPTPPGEAAPYPDPPADDGPHYTPPTNGEPAYPPAGGTDTPSPPAGGPGSPYPPGTPEPETIVGPHTPDAEEPRQTEPALDPALLGLDPGLFGFVPEAPEAPSVNLRDFIPVPGPVEFTFEDLLLPASAGPDGALLI